MDARALIGSLLVHGAAMLASAADPDAARRDPALPPETHNFSHPLRPPRVTVFTNRDNGPVEPIPDSPGAILREGCRPQWPVLVDAAPNFPVSGPDEPLAWLREMPRSPTFCALVGVDGRVAAIRLDRSSGEPSADAAILETLRTLPFRPAYRRAKPVAAWHQMVVSRFPTRP